MSKEGGACSGVDGGGSEEEGSEGEDEEFGEEMRQLELLEAMGDEVSRGEEVEALPTASSPTPLPPTGTLPSREPERQMALRHRSDPPGPAPPPQTPSPYTNGPSFSDSQPLETEPSN